MPDDDEPPECEPILSLDGPGRADVDHPPREAGDPDAWRKHAFQSDFDPGETVYHLFGWADRLVCGTIWVGAILLSILVYGAIGWIFW